MSASWQLQENLDLGAANLIALTHPTRPGYEECLWMVRDGNFPMQRWYSVLSAIVVVNSWVEDSRKDCYWTPNSFIFPQSQWGRGLPMVSRLNCLFVDLDYYNSDFKSLPVGDLINQIMADHPWLPVPSVVVDSGRGCWLVWEFSRGLVINDKTKKSADWMPQWYACQQFLNDLLAPYGADRNAIDAVRYMRMPETVNSKNGSVTRSWTSVSGKSKKTVKHSFTSLQALFRERSPKKQRKLTGNPQKGAVPHGKIDGIDTLLSAYSLAHNRIHDLGLLVENRGGRLHDMRKRFVDCYLTEAAMFHRSESAICDTVDAFIDQYIERPDFYKDYYRTHCAEKIRRATGAWNEKECGERSRLVLRKRGSHEPYIDDKTGAIRLDPFTNTNKRIIRLLDITQDEMRKKQGPHLHTLINKAEKAVRRREKAGAMSRDQYEARAQKRREEALKKREEGLSQRQIAKEMGLGLATINRYLRA